MADDEEIPIGSSLSSGGLSGGSLFSWPSAPTSTPPDSETSVTTASPIDQLVDEIETISPDIETLGTSELVVSEPSVKVDSSISLQQLSSPSASTPASGAGASGLSADALMAVYDATSACHTPSEVAKITGLTLDVVNRCVKVLADRGWIAQDEANRYCSIEAARKLKDKFKKICAFCQV